MAMYRETRWPYYKLNSVFSYLIEKNNIIIEINKYLYNYLQSEAVVEQMHKRVTVNATVKWNGNCGVEFRHSSRDASRIWWNVRKGSV